jgi:hypothetical protein
VTDQEAIRFVNEQVKGRNGRLTDVQFGDWVAVVRRTDEATARQIVKDIATDPDEPYLTAKVFAKRLRKHLASLRPAQPQPEPTVASMEFASFPEMQARILAGPDTPGKRWLQRHVATRGRPQVLVAAVARELPRVETPAPPRLPSLAKQSAKDIEIDQLQQR